MSHIERILIFCISEQVWQTPISCVLLVMRTFLSFFYEWCHIWHINWPLYVDYSKGFISVHRCDLGVEGQGQIFLKSICHKACNTNSSFIFRLRMFIFCTMVAYGVYIPTWFSDHQYDWKGQGKKSLTDSAKHILMRNLFLNPLPRCRDRIIEMPLSIHLSIHNTLSASYLLNHIKLV